MRIICSALFLFLCNTAYANNIIVNGTRFIYDEGKKEITVQMNNKAHAPALAQLWLDTGNPETPPESIVTPFILTPPIARIDAGSGQAVRIKHNASMPITVRDRESLWWLNVLDVPAIDNTLEQPDSALINMAIRSRFKFIWRPKGLAARDNAERNLIITASGNKLAIVNPTPFFITITEITTASNKNIIPDTFMIAPKSDLAIDIKDTVSRSQPLTIKSVNDYGGIDDIKITLH